MKNFILLPKKHFISCLFILWTVSVLAQTTWIVNNNPGAWNHFADLPSAINGAANGDILYVQHSPTSYGNVTLNKELTIIGRSHSDVGYKTQIGTLSLATGSSNSTIKGIDINIVNHVGSSFTLTGISFLDNDLNTVTFANTTNITVNNLLLQGNVFRGNFNLNPLSSFITISNNIFFSSSLIFDMVDSLLLTNNIFSYSNGTSFTNNASPNSLLTISDCIFVTNSASTRTITLNATGTNTFLVDNCVTYNYGAGNYTFETDSYITINGNVQENTNPLFTSVNSGSSGSLAGTLNQYDPLNDILTLQNGPALFGNEGLYEGYNFLNLGVPTGYPSLKITNYDPKIPKNGTLTVTIEAKTN